jgi:hypothetical protein
MGGFMDKNMRQAVLAALALTIAFGLTSCNRNNQQQSAQSTAQNPQDQDPAQVNQAPVGDQAASSNQVAASSETAPTEAPAPVEPQPDNSNYSSANSYPESSGTEPVEEAAQPPPPLPDYDQPACPDPNYIWTPGYWAWGSAGYYWAPGVWVAAPYVGALWTPGYWGFNGRAYRWHAGYWGPHIGFYGGVNYGFGYVGVGFLGGYWRNNSFMYNRAVTNVNSYTVTNVYSRTVVNNVIINNTRVSYNGGSGGVRYQPSPAELAASREAHVRALPEQVQVVRAAAAKRAQFASVNRGRPQMVATAKPVVVRPITPPAAAVNPGARKAAETATAFRAPMETRPATPAPRTGIPVRPRAETPVNAPNRAEPRREVPATRPAQPAPARPATRAPARPPAPHETQMRKAPPRQPAPAEKKQQRQSDERRPK